MEIVFRNKCSKESMTYSALLFDLLMENNKEYSSRKLLARKYQELYNVALYSSNSRVGETMLSNIIVDFLDPKYMEEDLLEEIIRLTFSMIFEPNVEDGEFDESTFNIVKNRLMCEIESLKEDPKQSSILAAFRNLDAKSPRAWNSSGDAEILKTITPKKLYKYYLDLLESALVDIYIIGDLDMKKIFKYVEKYSHFTSIKTHKIDMYLDEIKEKKSREVAQKNQLSQMNIVQIYALKGMNDFETDYVMPIFNLLWGSGSLESKLYKTLRGENSLCYNVSTFYQKYDRNIIVHTAIDKENRAKTNRLIKTCLQDMVKGNISSEELENIKNMLINSLNLIYDSPSRLIDNYLFSNIANLPDIDERIDEFKSVTIQDLINVAKKVKLVLDYRIGE